MEELSLISPGNKKKPHGPIFFPLPLMNWATILFSSGRKIKRRRGGRKTEGPSFHDKQSNYLVASGARRSMPSPIINQLIISHFFEPISLRVGLWAVYSKTLKYKKTAYKY